MGRGRERFADMIESAVSFGTVKLNITGSRVSGQSRKRATADFLRQTAAGKRVQHALTAPKTGLTHLIRHSDRPLSAILNDWAEGLEQDHADKKQASGNSGGTVMENATVAMYNGGYLTLGVTKRDPFGRDGRIWLVYHALGGPVIEDASISIEDLQKATGGHHITGEYKMSAEKLAQREHSRILGQLIKVIPRALELEVELAAKNQEFEMPAAEFVEQLKIRFEERRREKNGDAARTAETREETPPKQKASPKTKRTRKPKATPEPKATPKQKATPTVAPVKIPKKRQGQKK